MTAADVAWHPRNMMSFAIRTHDGWGVVTVASFPTLEEARSVFASLCQDPWYRQDGSVRGLELVQCAEGSQTQRLDWLAF